MTCSGGGGAVCGIVLSGKWSSIRMDSEIACMHRCIYKHFNRSFATLLRMHHLLIVDILKSGEQLAKNYSSNLDRWTDSSSMIDSCCNPSISSVLYATNHRERVHPCLRRRCRCRAAAPGPPPRGWGWGVRSRLLLPGDSSHQYDKNYTIAIVIILVPCVNLSDAILIPVARARIFIVMRRWRIFVLPYHMQTDEQSTCSATDVDGTAISRADRVNNLVWWDQSQPVGRQILRFLLCACECPKFDSTVALDDAPHCIIIGRHNHLPRTRTKRETENSMREQSVDCYCGVRRYRIFYEHHHDDDNDEATDSRN